MVDALDLKSIGSRGPCRFESCRPHHCLSGRRRFLRGLAAAGVLGFAGVGRARGETAVPFRLACGWPGSGTWERGQDLTRQLFVLKHDGVDGDGGDDGDGDEADGDGGLGGLSFRAITANGDLGSRALLDGGEVESALLERLPRGRGGDLTAEGRRLGVVGFSALHCLAGAGVRVGGDRSRPFAGLGMALVGLNREGEAEQIGALGAEIKGPFTQARGLEVFLGGGAEGLVFWDAVPSPAARDLLVRGAARLVALTLRDEPTRFFSGEEYPGAGGVQGSVRRLDWVLGGEYWWGGAVRGAASRILDVEEEEGSLWL